MERVTNKNKVIQPKEGWTFGILPAISFDTDVGFQYGALANLYYYGDGSKYPEYLQSLYLEWSQTTRGSGIARFYYDSKYLIPGIRLTADISYLTEKAMQFYGFNGYDAVYHSEWEDDTDPGYVSRVFFRHDRKIFRIMANFQGNIIKEDNRFRWITGFAYYNNSIGPVDIDRLNKGKSEDEKLPAVDGLYDKYVEWDVITDEEKDGTVTTYLKAGLIYDTRDFEALPFKGIWSEAVISYSPSFLGDDRFSYSKLTLIHRQYFTLVPGIMSFAYRVGYQGTLTGTVPFHMQPHIVPTFLTGATSQGLGGSRTLRGVLRNRVVGDGIVLGNLELRLIFYRTVIFNQNLYIGTNLFFDAGRVVDEMDIDFSGAEEELGEDFPMYFNPGAESVHMSSGIGLKVGLNENFIVSLDFGKAFDRQDGNTGFYINLNYLF
ncbi:MAG: BamA/TamA family outer membrane protein [Cyclobacteriaceae bacterium]|nr:BamA/TamA family outer membrane protein [Cyclobacteriaceae bacterium]